MPKAFPVKHGDGREVGDLSAYMRTLLLDCQQSLQTLLKQDDDLKLKLATIKLILDYGYGRPRPITSSADDGTTLTLEGPLEAMFLKIGKPHLHDDKSMGEPHEPDALPAQHRRENLDRNSPPEPNDT